MPGVHGSGLCRVRRYSGLMGSITPISSSCWAKRVTGSPTTVLQEPSTRSTSMRSQQQVVSYLCPYSIPLYRKHGWEIVSDKMTFTIKDTQLPKRHPVDGQIERVDIECEDLHRVYKYFALQQHGALIRGKLEWEEYGRWDSDDVMGLLGGMEITSRL